MTIEDRNPKRKGGKSDREILSEQKLAVEEEPRLIDRAPVRYGIAAVFLLVYVLTGLSSCQEMQYRFLGVEAVGTVDRVYDDEAGSGKRVADFRYTDQYRALQRDTARFSHDAQVKAGDRLELYYIPGVKFTAILAERRSSLALFFFALLNVAALVLVIVRVRTVVTDVRRMAKRVDLRQ